jgi:hypothetical protein
LPAQRPTSFPPFESSLPDIIQWLAIWDPEYIHDLHAIAYARVQRIQKNQRRSDDK